MVLNLTTLKQPFNSNLWFLHLSMNPLILVISVVIKNILTKYGTPICFPTSWHFETSNISLLKVTNSKKSTPQKYLGSTSESFTFPNLDFTWVVMLVTKVSNLINLASLVLDSPRISSLVDQNCWPYFSFFGLS